MKPYPTLKIIILGLLCHDSIFRLGVGQLMAALDEHQLSDNTLIILTSDNGGAGYLGLPNVNQPFRGWKLTHFEGGTHVPFMAKWPAQIPTGTVMDHPIHHIDLFHTIAVAAGAEVPQDRKFDGVNLLPYIRNEVLDAPHHTLFWREGHQQTVLHHGWKLIRADIPTKPWLFNLQKDPTEQHNLVDIHPEKVQELQALLIVHNAEPLWPSVIDSPQLIDKTAIEPYIESDEYIYWPN